MKVPPAPTTRPVDQTFLDEFQHAAWLYFAEQAHPATGLVADRAPADGSKHNDVASIAATGFGLTALCVAESRGWIAPAEAYERALRTLRFLWEKTPHEHGFFYHFLDAATGQRVWDCELSSIDTALLMAGVLSVRQQYPNSEVADLAARLYERVDWAWMLNGGQTLSMGWTPEKGFLDARWDGYSEHLILYLLALGSPTHPIPPQSWHAWRRSPIVTENAGTFLACPPLFTHQYPQAWLDLRGLRDAHADYFRNSVLATTAQRKWCVEQAGRFDQWGPLVWGLTASDVPGGYAALGALPPAGPIDGTLTPAAPAGSLIFDKPTCLATLINLRDRFGASIWRRYGFVGSFNPQTGWTSPDVIGIDVGNSLLMAENARNGLPQQRFMANAETRRALDRAGFVPHGGTLPPEDVEYLRALAADTWRCIQGLVEPSTGLPYDNSKRDQWTSVSNIGLYLTDIAAAQAMGWIDRDEALRQAGLTLASLEKLKTSHGFQQCWNSVKGLQPATHDTWVSILDSGNLAGGLLALGEALPELRPRTGRLLDAMQWSVYYDPDQQVLCGGLDTATGQINRQWRLNAMGTDARLAVFLAIASGQAPAAVWDKLDRRLEERHHVRYLWPGWDGGGLFMQYINGLWLDERDTFMERSAANFAYAQVRHAREIGSAVWGWSASAGPDGDYLGWAKLRDSVVTPHACVLAVKHFPAEVVKNLRALEQLGARPADLGFVDAVELPTGRRHEGYLLLDQSMVLLSLVNYLHEDVVRGWFSASEPGKRGYTMIRDYAQRNHGANNAVYDLGGGP